MASGHERSSQKDCKLFCFVWRRLKGGRQPQVNCAKTEDPWQGDDDRFLYWPWLKRRVPPTPTGKGHQAKPMKPPPSLPVKHVYVSSDLPGNLDFSNPNFHPPSASSRCPVSLRAWGSSSPSGPITELGVPRVPER